VTLFNGAFQAHVDGAAAAEPVVIAPIVDIVDGRAICDVESQATKQPDWTHDDVDSGSAPAERLATASPDADRPPS
jgi:hypothetical protein